MIKKNTKEKLLANLGLITAIIFGVIFVLDVLFTGLMAIGCIGSLVDGSSDLVVSIIIMTILVLICLFFGAVAVLGTVVFVIAKKKNNKIKKYLNVISVEKKLESIAAAMGKDYETVKFDVKAIIEKGYLGNAYLNEENGEIIIIDSKNKNSSKANTPISTKKIGRVVGCTCCGANNTIFEDVGKCEFCGAPLK